MGHLVFFVPLAIFQPYNSGQCKKSLIVRNHTYISLRDELGIKILHFTKYTKMWDYHLKILSERPKVLAK